MLREKECVVRLLVGDLKVILFRNVLVLWYIGTEKHRELSRISGVQANVAKTSHSFYSLSIRPFFPALPKCAQNVLVVITHLIPLLPDIF